MTNQLRSIFRAYWACRSSSYDVAARVAAARLAVVSDALRSGWTNEQIAALDLEAKQEVIG